MNLIKPGIVPYIFLAISAVFAVNWVRHRGEEGERIAQRIRLRMLAIFAVVGVALLVWRAVG